MTLADRIAALEAAVRELRKRWPKLDKPEKPAKKPA